MPRSCTARSQREWSRTHERYARVLFHALPRGAYPGEIGIVRGGHGAAVCRERVQVVEVEAVGGARRVVAERHEHEVAVADGHRDVDLMSRAVEPLNGERLRARGPVVVRLLEDDLAGRVVLVVLVWGIARPVAGRREHLDDEQALRWELRLEDVIDLPGRVAGAANLDLDIVRRDK